MPACIRPPQEMLESLAAGKQQYICGPDDHGTKVKVFCDGRFVAMPKSGELHKKQFLWKLYGSIGAAWEALTTTWGWQVTV